MRIIRLTVLPLAILTAVIVGLRLPAIENTPESIRPSRTDQRILRARQAIAQMPKNSAGYNQLAAAYMQKARETEDLSFNANAENAINRSLAVDPDNYDGLKLRAKLQLTNHRFAEALQTARHAQTFRNDDHDVWGQITDALVELGDYAGAVQAAQRMIDLRPDSSAYARVSYLRSLHGDIEGAIQAMTAAVKAANPNDPESVAWYRAQLGNELLNAGRLKHAEREFDAALLAFPNHSLALAGKTRTSLLHTGTNHPHSHPK